MKKIKKQKNETLAKGIHDMTTLRSSLRSSCLGVTALALLSLAAARPAAAQTTTTFGSDTTWSVNDASGTSLGNAQYVVLNNQYPTRQPPGATDYGVTTTSPVWQADLSSIPGAYWIWAPGITGATPDASLAQFSFSHQFFLSGTPTAGTISIAVDDSASVYVNGTLAGSTGSISDISQAFQAQSALATFDIAPYLTSGQNTILVDAQNGPDTFSGGGPHAPYSVNEAGVVFGGSLTSDASPVPEASQSASLGLLLALGMGGLVIAARRKKMGAKIAAVALQDKLFLRCD